MQPSIREKFIFLIPIVLVISVWLTLFDSFHIFTESPKLLAHPGKIILVLFYGVASTFVVSLIIAFVGLVIRNFVWGTEENLSCQIGGAIGFLGFMVVFAIGYPSLRESFEGFGLLAPRFIFTALGTTGIAVIVGFVISEVIGTLYEVPRWSGFLSVWLSAGIASMVFIYGSISNVNRGDGNSMLYYIIFLVTGVIVWAVLRAFIRVTYARSTLAVTLFIVLMFAVPTVFSLNPRQDPDLKAHNSATGKHGKNVILISMDTCRYDRLGCNGNESIETPNIDLLAEQGVIFDNCIVNMPVTIPSHYSMLTGLTPRNHNARDMTIPLDPSYLTLPEYLEDEGFTSGGIISMVFMTSDDSNIDQGFNYFDDAWVYRKEGRFFPRQIKYFRAARIVNLILTGRTINPNPYDRKAKPAVDHAIEWLEEVKEDDFFGFLHVFDPHWDYNAPEPFTTKYDPDYDGTFLQHRSPGKELFGAGTEFAEEDFDHLVARYDGEVSYVDEQLGRLFDRLRELELWDETMIILTSDHGESFGNDYYFGHADRVYQSCIHVPLIIKPFGGAEGQRITGLCSNTDFFPTVCDALGIETPAGLDGKSLASVLEGGAALENPHEMIFSETYPLPNDPQHRGKQYSVTTKNDKLIYSPTAFPFAPVFQYYIISLDPHEERDSYEIESSTRVDELKALLIKWASEDTQSDQSAGAIERENLKSLQYLN